MAPICLTLGKSKYTSEKRTSKSNEWKLKGPKEPATLNGFKIKSLYGKDEKLTGTWANMLAFLIDKKALVGVGSAGGRDSKLTSNRLLIDTLGRLNELKEDSGADLKNRLTMRLTRDFIILRTLEEGGYTCSSWKGWGNTNNKTNIIGPILNF